MTTVKGGPGTSPESAFVVTGTPVVAEAREAMVSHAASAFGQAPMGTAAAVSRRGDRAYLLVRVRVHGELTARWYDVTEAVHAEDAMAGNAPRPPSPPRQYG